MTKPLSLSDLSPDQRKWAMSDDALDIILDHMIQHPPETVVEFGSGYSTVVLARQLREQGFGRVVSFDHDLAYARKTSEWLDQDGPRGYAIVWRTPLSPSLGWYDADISAYMDRIDLCLVDGPPSLSGRPHTRLPALLAVSEQLAEAHGTLFLDDLDREGEQQIWAAWKALYPQFDFTEYDVGRGLGKVQA